MRDTPIYVTRPLLPPLSEFIPYLEQIWSSKWVTNGGPFHAELEGKLAEYLNVKHISLFTNGTIALITALQSLELSGEVITTPYSFVATAHALLWNNITPVFVDIDPISFNINPELIEEAISRRTTAILPVHCYGIPCDVDAIRRVADAHGIKIVYDAAHAFGIQRDGESILQFGDLSIMSFHATKVFHTFEGGAIISPDAATKRHIDQLKNFGFVDETTVVAAGINGKMSEVHAAMGLLHLRHMDDAIQRRHRISQLYKAHLTNVGGIRTQFGVSNFSQNYSYFPIVIDEGFRESRDALYFRMRDAGIFSRRYFYPLISDLPMYKELPSAQPENLPCARRIADCVLCLPIYPDMNETEAMRVINAIRG